MLRRIHKSDPMARIFQKCLSSLLRFHYSVLSRLADVVFRMNIFPLPKVKKQKRIPLPLAFSESRERSTPDHRRTDHPSLQTPSSGDRRRSLRQRRMDGMKRTRNRWFHATAGITPTIDRVRPTIVPSDCRPGSEDDGREEVSRQARRQPVSVLPYSGTLCHRRQGIAMHDAWQPPCRRRYA